MDIKEELRKEYRKGENWFDQISNILTSIFLAVGTWLMLVSILTGPVLALTLWNVEWTLEGQAQLKEIALPLFQIFGGLAGMLVIGFNLPRRIRNVFWDNAARRVNHYNDVKLEFENDVKTIELILEKHNLIKRDR